MNDLRVIILAAGKGTRMKSRLPKVLHRVFGAPMVYYVIRAAETLSPEEIVLIVGYRKEQVTRAVSGQNVFFVEQAEPRGTGDAVNRVRPRFDGYAGDVLVMCGDVPLVRSETLRRLLDVHRADQPAVTVLTAVLENPHGYGRIMRNGSGLLENIVEEADANEAQRATREVNSGVYIFHGPKLFDALAEIRPDNAKGEYYLTDAVRILRARGERVAARDFGSPEEIAGVNTREELRKARAVLKKRGRLDG